MCRKTTSPCEKAVPNHNSFYVRPSIAIPFLFIALYAGLRFAQVFPFLLWKEGATLYYKPANYFYDDLNTRFDNTIWTYGTDYTIAVIMACGAIHMWRTCSTNSHSTLLDLRFYSACMLACYSISVSCGGFAHHNFLTIDSLNTKYFQAVWFLCVGSVTLAGGFIGAIGTELAKSLHGMNSRFNIPILPNYFWFCWGIFHTSVCFMGGLSYKRPACDIFIAGTTQTLPTFYTCLVLLSRHWRPEITTPSKLQLLEIQTKSDNKSAIIAPFYAKLQMKISLTHRIFFLIGFLANAPLLPAYPILLSLGLELGKVNSILHSNLLIAWGLQYLTLVKFVAALRDIPEELVDGKKQK